jgi:prepilin-type N-terminal cleavage/methylation domain-containing protein
MHISPLVIIAMKKKQSNVNKWKTQQGFTLIEIATVMVIMGLIMGSGVILTQSLIRGMHAKDLMTTIKDISTSVRYFKEKYHYLPGDIPNAGNKISGVSTTCNIASTSNSPETIGNGLIDTTTEAGCALEHLHLAGFISSFNQNSTSPHLNKLQSRYGDIKIMANSNVKGNSISSCSTVQTSRSTVDVPIYSYVLLPSTVLNVIEVYNLPWDIANDIDDTLDDDNFVDLAGGQAAGTVQVDIDCGTAGNQGPTDMTSLIPFLAVPL